MHTLYDLVCSQAIKIVEQFSHDTVDSLILWMISCEKSINLYETNHMSFSSLVMAHLKIKSFLNSIEFLSKFFLLSPHGVCEKPTWKDFRISNGFVLTGLIAYFYFHLNYVMFNDNASERVKLVTYFIDSYNKYSGLMMVTILVLVQYFQQSKSAKINKTFEDIDGIFLKELGVRIGNVRTMR